jgi:hypothetical protein
LLQKVGDAKNLCHCSVSLRRLKRAIKAALDSGVDPEENVLKEASHVADALQDSLHSKTLNEWKAEQLALGKVQVQIRNHYRPGLERALTEAEKIGVDDDHPDMLHAKHLLEELRVVEDVTRKQVSKREEMGTHATDMLKNALQLPRDHRAHYLEEALSFAERAGLSPETVLVRQAKDALKVALISMSVSRRGSSSSRHLSSNSKEDKKEEKQPARKPKATSRPKTYLKRGDGLKRSKTEVPSEEDQADCRLDSLEAEADTLASDPDQQPVSRTFTAVSRYKKPLAPEDSARTKLLMRNARRHSADTAGGATGSRASKPMLESHA